MSTSEARIDRIPSETARIPLLGTMPLIVNNFSEKARRELMAPKFGQRAPKELRDPDGEYQRSLYYMKDGQYAFPAMAFKKATIGAARFYGKQVTMTGLRQTLFFRAEIGQDEKTPMVPIAGEPRMREDLVRLGGMSNPPDIRYRAEFPEWSTIITVTYVTSGLSLDSLLSLVDAGGLGVGVGEWRPEKSGEFGTYQVDPTRDVEVLS